MPLHCLAGQYLPSPVGLAVLLGPRKLHSSAGKHPFSKGVMLQGHQAETAGAGVGWEGVPTASPSAVLNGR